MNLWHQMDYAPVIQPCVMHTHYMITSDMTHVYIHHQAVLGQAVRSEIIHIHISMVTLWCDNHIYVYMHTCLQVYTHFYISTFNVVMLQNDDV
jgi:hypothetical protein